MDRPCSCPERLSIGASKHEEHAAMSQKTDAQFAEKRLVLNPFEPIGIVSK
jgi:hypothetical protein